MRSYFQDNCYLAVINNKRATPFICSIFLDAECTTDDIHPARFELASTIHPFHLAFTMRPRDNLFVQFN